MNGKIIIGLSEVVRIIGKNKTKRVAARIDSGATMSSIDVDIAAELLIGPVIKTKLVKSATGKSVRPVVHITIELKGKKIRSEFTIANRRHMKYGLLIGQNILKKGFLIDPSKK